MNGAATYLDQYTVRHDGERQVGKSLTVKHVSKGWVDVTLLVRSLKSSHQKKLLTRQERQLAKPMYGNQNKGLSVRTLSEMLDTSALQVCSLELPHSQIQNPRTATLHFS